MATKKTKSMSKGRVKVNKLKVGKEKAREMTDKEVKRIRGGTEQKGLTRPFKY
jgi:hypothetical protein